MGWEAWGYRKGRGSQDIQRQLQAFLLRLKLVTSLLPVLSSYEFLFQKAFGGTSPAGHFLWTLKDTELGLHILTSCSGRTRSQSRFPNPCHARAGSFTGLKRLTPAFLLPQNRGEPWSPVTRSAHFTYWITCGSLHEVEVTFGSYLCLHHLARSLAPSWCSIFV